MPELRTARENARLEIGSQRGRNSHQIGVLGIYDLQGLSYGRTCVWGGGEQGSLASARGSRAASERAAGEGGRSAAYSAPRLSRVTAWAKRGQAPP